MPSISRESLNSRDLFHAGAPELAPLAHRLRPRSLNEVVGQDELTAPGSWFARSLDEGRAVSCIFWGPPGVGKTTLAQIMAAAAKMPFVHLSAVSAGKAEVRDVVDRARAEGRSYLLFLDEIHRFNKAQQDVLLPFIEDGTLVLVGATTENPSFSLNNALLSRCRLIVLRALEAKDIEKIVSRGIAALREGSPEFDLEQESARWLAAAAGGDARYALNALESLWLAASDRCWGLAGVQEYWTRRAAQYDRSGDFHYDLISALHKCVRDSDADAAIYWLARMLDAGEEPRYIVRRLIRMATEDVGLADPNALAVCIHAQRMYDILGSPEGEQGLFTAAIYLALAPKSNAAYMAEKAARRLAKDTQDGPVPMHLRNAPTKLMKELGHGAGYQYAHDAPDAVVAQSHFPEDMKPETLYHPTDRGFEKRLSERINWLESRRKQKKSETGS